MLPLFQKAPQPQSEPQKITKDEPKKSKKEIKTLNQIASKRKAEYESLPAVARLVGKEKQLDLFKKLATQTQSDKDLQKAADMEQEVIALKKKVDEEEKYERERREMEKRVEEMAKYFKQAKENISNLIKMGLSSSLPIAKGLLIPIRKIELKA